MSITCWVLSVCTAAEVSCLEIEEPFLHLLCARKQSSVNHCVHEYSSQHRRPCSHTEWCSWPDRPSCFEWYFELVSESAGHNNGDCSLTIPASLFQLIQTNKLKHYPSIHGDFSSEFRQPCVVFTGHPSLRFGDVVHFMELWGKSSLNTIIFTGNCITSTPVSRMTTCRPVIVSKACGTFLSHHQSQTFLTWMLCLPTSHWLWSVFTVPLTHGSTSIKYQSCSRRSRYGQHLPSHS